MTRGGFDTRKRVTDGGRDRVEAYPVERAETAKTGTQGCTKTPCHHGQCREAPGPSSAGERLDPNTYHGTGENAQRDLRLGDNASRSRYAYDATARAAVQARAQ